MRAYRVSKTAAGTIEDKINLVKTYDVGDLLYVLRDIEQHPKDYDKEIITAVTGNLYNMGIMCM